MNSNYKRIVKNSIFLLSRTIFLTLVTLYTLREVISILGADGFGLYSVVFGIVTMFAFINSAMMSATQRYLSFEIGKKNIEGIKKNLLSSIFIHTILAITLSVLIFLLKDFFINDVLNVKKFMVEAGYIYNFAIIGIFISILQVPFSALITAYEKMQAFAYLAIFEGISKLLVVYLLLYFNYNKVVLYSLFLTIISIFIFLLHVLYCNLSFSKVINIFSLKISEVKPLLSRMLGFMGWSLIGNLSVVMRNHGANILLNVFFGLIFNAAFTISMTIMSAISTLVSAVSNAINPQIFKKYAENNIKGFLNLIEYGTKYYMYFISLIIFPLIFTMEYILNLWLGDVSESVLDFCKLALILVLIDSFSSLIIIGIQATGNIKWNQICTGSLLLMVVPLSYMLFKMGYGQNTIFCVAIFFSFISIFVRLIFLCNSVAYSIKRYIKKVFIPVILFQLIVYFSNVFWFSLFEGNYNLFEFLLFLMSTTITSIVFLYLFIFDSAERNGIRKIKSNFIKKFV